MNLTGDRRIPAGREAVFVALCDPDVLMRCIPVLEHMARRTPTEYEARVRASVGPLKARFAGRVLVDPIDPPGHYHLFGEGDGILGFAKGTVRIWLAEEDGRTTLTYALSAEIGGKLGRMAAGLLVEKAQRHVDRFFDRFVMQFTE